MGKIAEFLKTIGEQGIGPKEQLKEKIDVARENLKKLKAQLSKAEGDSKVAIQRKIDGVSQTLKTYRKMYKEKFGESLGEEEGGDSMANNGQMPTDGASKTKGFIKELIDTSWSGSNEEQMKAVELLKGLAVSDEPEANDFMKKLDDFTSSMKDSEPAKESLGMTLFTLGHFEEAKGQYGDKEYLKDLNARLKKDKELVKWHTDNIKELQLKIKDLKDKASSPDANEPVNKNFPNLTKKKMYMGRIEKVEDEIKQSQKMIDRYKDTKEVEDEIKKVKAHLAGTSKKKD